MDRRGNASAVEDGSLRHREERSQICRPRVSTARWMYCETTYLAINPAVAPAIMTWVLEPWIPVRSNLSSYSSKFTIGAYLILQVLSAFRHALVYSLPRTLFESFPLERIVDCYGWRWRRSGHCGRHLGCFRTRISKLGSCDLQFFTSSTIIHGLLSLGVLTRSFLPCA